MYIIQLRNCACLCKSMTGPEKRAHGKIALGTDISNDRQAVLSQEAIELPLRHRLVIVRCVPGVVQGHLEASNYFLFPHLFLAPICYYLAHRVRWGTYCAYCLLLLLLPSSLIGNLLGILVFLSKVVLWKGIYRIEDDNGVQFTSISFLKWR
jgi:hypothetical protein